MEYIHSVKIQNIVMQDPFWNGTFNVVKNNTLPYQWKIMNDSVPGQEPSYVIRNFRLASSLQCERKAGKNTPVYSVDKWHYTPDNSAEGSFFGWVFQDTDLYKWLEAVSFVLMREENKELGTLAAEAADLICSSALENGYLDTLYIINNPTKIFTNLKDNHELYCFAHLTEAAIAYYRATGKSNLLNAACNFADFICAEFGDGGRAGYGGHPISEYAFTKLYELTGNSKYLHQASLFINRRGTKPYYFDTERNIKTDGSEYVYNIANKPLREQTAAEGHAVRALYLYTGAAAVARLNGDSELSNTCERLFDNIAEKQMYITGGVGAAASGEAFTFNYNLPNDTAYCESCASIGLMMFARRMQLITPNSKYADVMERCMYNCILSGISSDGMSFFYTNPLEVSSRDCKLNPSLSHVKTERQGWFNCACCPTNIARLICSFSEYCFSESDSTLYIDMYVASSVNTSKADVEIKSDYLKTGRVSLNIKAKKKFTLALRIPGFAGNFKFSRNDFFVKEGYAYFNITADTKISADFDFSIKLVKCNNNVKTNMGKIALQKGPVVYCLESNENGENLHLLRLVHNPNFEDKGDSILADGYRQSADGGILYSEYEEPSEEKVKLKFIPYRNRAGANAGDMSVWVRY